MLNYKFIKLLCALLLSSMFISACSVLPFPDKDEKSHVESNSKNKKSKDTKKSKSKKDDKEVISDKAISEINLEESSFVDVALPENSSQNEGNTMGNLLSWGRMVQADDTLYFRNPFDNERLYSMDADGTLKLLLKDIYLKDLHIFEGYIYFAATSPGDVSGIEFSDKNLYRYHIDSGSVEKLTNINFMGNDTWLSFDILLGSKAYFSYHDGSKQGYWIARCNLDGSGFEQLHLIEPSKVAGNPFIHIVNNTLYFINTEGLNSINLDTGEHSLSLANFKCDDYLIYNNYIYYISKRENASEAMRIARIPLSGGAEEALFSTEGSYSWVGNIQMNFYDANIYLLLKSEDERRGEIYKAADDLSNLVQLSDRANWFNIVSGKLIYKFSDFDNMEISRRESLKYINLYASNLESNSLFDTAQFNKGWVVIDNAWYYYDEQGNFKRNSWFQFDNQWMYLGPDGKMMTNTWIDDKYYVGADGRILKNQLIDAGDLYYVGEDGVRVTNRRVEVGGNAYYFGADGKFVYME